MQLNYMLKMEELQAGLRFFHRFLAQAATVQIYAYPHFLLEFVLSLLLGCVYMYLSLEVGKIYKHSVNIRPNTIHFMKSLKGNFSKESISTSVTHVHEFTKFDVISGAKPYFISKHTKRTTSNSSRVEWLMGNEPKEFFKPIIEENSNKAVGDKLSALTPAQFVKLDKERQLRERQIKGCMHSLTTLFDNIVAKKYSDSRLKEQIETAKEEVVCSRVTDQVMKYLDSESITDSLINVLNDIVDDASAENPFPVHGDLTTLVHDIGNLKSSLLFDTKCELVQSSTSGSTLTKTDGSDHDG